MNGAASYFAILAYGALMVFLGSRLRPSPKPEHPTEEVSLGRAVELSESVESVWIKTHGGWASLSIGPDHPRTPDQMLGATVTVTYEQPPPEEH